jgi:hypothetical protein
MIVLHNCKSVSVLARTQINTLFLHTFIIAFLCKIKFQFQFNKDITLKSHINFATINCNAAHVSSDVGIICDAGNRNPSKELALGRSSIPTNYEVFVNKKTIFRDLFRCFK